MEKKDPLDYKPVTIPELIAQDLEKLRVGEYECWDAESPHITNFRTYAFKAMKIGDNFHKKFKAKTADGLYTITRLK